MTSANATGPSPSVEKKEDNYIFNRGWKSSLRLNFNHFLMKETAGYLLHPSVPVDMPQIRIADVGTGTGIWACELAGQMPPSARIDGFDVSAAQFPAADFCAPNVRFVAHDGFEDYPPEFHNQYDVVHVRFLLCTINDPVAKQFLQRVLTLVKPGGYLQWFEPLPRSCRVASFREGAETTNTDRLAKTFHKPKEDSSYDWVEGMPQMFRDNGLVDVMAERHVFPKWILPLWAQSCLMTTEDVLPKINIWNNEQGGMAHPFMVGLEKELAAGVAVDLPFQCVIGQKT